MLDDLGVTPNQVWGLTRTDPAWATTLEAALTATRRDDLQHGTNAASSTAASAATAEPISGSGWQGTAGAAMSLRLSPRVVQFCRL